MATSGQRRRKLKQRQNHVSRRSQLQVGNAEVIANIDDYKGVKGMKKKILKMVDRIKNRARKIKRWFQKEDVQNAGIAIGVVAGTAVFGFVVGNVVGQIKIMKETGPIINELKKHMRSNSRVLRAYAKMMDAFWTENPESRTLFEAFRKNWNADEMMVVVTS